MRRRRRPATRRAFSFVAWVVGGGVCWGQFGIFRMVLPSPTLYLLRKKHMQKSNPLRAITTRYQGYAFRSRLEARWAVFFDHLKIRWDYEPEGFELGNGLRYLPDFWLPDWKIWVEVKPDAPDDVTAEKASRLAAQSEYPIFVTNGMPGQGGTLYLCNDLHGSRCGDAEVDWAATDGKFMWLFTDELRRDMALPTASEAEIFTVPANRSPQCGVEEWYSPGAKAAVAAARGSRFEFGEKGGAK